MKRKWALLVLGALVGAPIAVPSRGQGTFANLNFEAANIPANTPDGVVVTVTQALPGWTVLSGGGVGYNFETLGGAYVSLFGPSYGAIQGNYSASLVGQFFPEQPPYLSAAIGQTGQIPQDAQTLIFWASPGNSLQAAFDGQMLPLIQLGSGANYVVEAANISSYAGKTGQLSFTASPLVYGGFNLLDNIQFSSSAIPEPGTCVLLFCGAVLLGLTRCRCGAWSAGPFSLRRRSKGRR
jgi:hypothetical protein